jgi:hypothetical protein
MALAGCPAADHREAANDAANRTATQPRPAQVTRVALIASDLGLGDGAFVREADLALAELAEKGAIGYRLVGTMPEPLNVEAGVRDVGLPHSGSLRPGEMVLSEAEALLDGR